MSNESAIAAVPEPLHSRASYTAFLDRVSRLSVTNYADPFTHIDWDARENQLSAGDPRWCIAADHPLARTSWYAGLDPETRARFGLTWTAQRMRYGMGFEAVLSRGLLAYTQSIPVGSPEYRYVMHEVIEEVRHSLMFHELVRRSGVQTHTVSERAARLDDRVAEWGRTNPVLLMFAVWGGELFTDEYNRAELRRPAQEVHPLLRQVMKIHVFEEARHMAFARRFLVQHMRQITRLQRAWMGIVIPISFANAARVMLEPDTQLIRDFRIPPRALRLAFGPHSQHRERLRQMTRPVRELCARSGLLHWPHAAAWKLAGF